MGVFEMMVAIVMITVVGGLIRTQMKANRGGKPSPEHDKRVADLEARVRALEEVVGDKSYELKEKLRDLEKSA